MQENRWSSVSGMMLATLLLAGAALAQNKAKTETITGTVTDNMCGLKHTMGNKVPKDCAPACVKMMDAKYALAVGDKVYELDGKTADLAKMGGAKAKVTGTVDGKTIHVTAVTAP